jgi:hypothetical protein
MSVPKNVCCIGENIFTNFLIYIKKMEKRNRLDSAIGKNEERECGR